MEISEEKYREQEARETDAFQMAALKVREREDKKARRGEVTAGEQALFPEIQFALEDAIKAFLEKQKECTKAHTAKLKMVCDFVGYDTIAAIMVREVFRLCLTSKRRLEAGIPWQTIGNALEEILPPLAKAFPAKSAKARKERKLVCDYLGRDNSCPVMATILLQCFCATGYVVSLPPARKNSSKRLALSPDTADVWQKATDDPDRAVRALSLMPMVVPPKPYSRFCNIGFITDHMQKAKRFKDKMKPLRRMAEPSRMWDVMNAIQDVPLRINRDVLELQRKLLESDEGAVLVRGDISVDVPVPTTEGIAEEALPLVWRKQKYAKAHNQNAVVQRLRSGIFFNEADKLKDAPLWLACFPDWRARIYAASAMSHQGPDPIKALFSFWNGKALGPSGLRWLKIHTATQGDFPLEEGSHEKTSKASMDCRVQWVDDNIDRIREMVADPLTNMWWADADMPFVFYAACCDLIRALDFGYPEAYVSYLPCAVDGANSGLQHYSAALRAEEGRYVSLTPADKPADFYALVADRVRGYAQEMVDTAGSVNTEELDGLLDAIRELGDVEDDPGAQKAKHELEEKVNVIVCALWLHEGITRSTVKRMAMTYVYTSGAYGFTEQVMTDFMRPLATKAMMAGESFGFGNDGGFRAALWMGHATYRAVSDLLPLVHKGMTWLQQVAGLLASEGLPVEFETPMGFPVKIEQKTTNLMATRVLLDGRSIQVKHYSEGGISARGQRSSTPPNTIHACDAAHLQMVVNGLVNSGITDMLLVHDEFATHAGAMDSLTAILRASLVRLYEDWSPFWAIYENAGMRLSQDGFSLLQGEEVVGDNRAVVGPPPKIGALRLDDINRAEYAFA